MDSTGTVRTVLSRTLKMLRATHLRRAYVTIPVEMACHLKASH